MSRTYKVFLVTAYPQRDLVRTMKRLLACLALCASFSASAQDDNCTVLGIQDLTQMVIEFQAANDTLQSQINSLQDQLNNLTFSVDELPPCNDFDGDGICDFADACPPFIVSFTYMWNGNQLVGEYLNAGDDYNQASLSFLEAPEACLNHISLVGANLYGANLRLADLSGANLSAANLYDADLFRVNFSDANLSNAWLNDAILIYANLSGANLTGANLSNALILSANLSGANLSGANLSDANFSDTDLSGVNLSDANLSGAVMNCLRNCPSALPPGYSCQPQDCWNGDRYHIFLE